MKIFTEHTHDSNKNFNDEEFWREIAFFIAALLSYPYSVDSGVTLTAYDEVDYILDRGTRIQQQRQHFRLSATYK